MADQAYLNLPSYQANPELMVSPPGGYTPSYDTSIGLGSYRPVSGLQNNSSLFNSPAATGGTTAGDLVQKGSMLAAFIPAVGPIISGLGTIAGGVMNYFSAKSAREDAQKAQQQQIEMYNEAQAEDTRRYNKEFNLTERQVKLKETQQQFENKLTKEQVKLQREKLKADTMVNAMARMTFMLNNPSRSGSQIWGGR